ncbi:hypothetical protein [Stakelama saccharophila]|uniref:Uncharacterized protein n=1 Tax=Stakelama saccharophila TaxID=3075605 RepID=A0ABZ0B7A4_9SPHN|nr:hypothetical protein [Stakelama sp. W311]WNO53263.1 hypothetical protein RPR59_12540 [Stakelama sp. W311]
MRFVFAAALLPVILSACGPNRNADGPGGVTVGEAEALNDAAAMLDNDSVSANAVGTNEESE